LNLRPPDLQPGALIDGTGLNFSPESNAMQGVVVCDTKDSNK
jgi:hypothetical protein